MQVDREALLTAAKAASSIVDPNHSIPIFTKIWLLEDHILGFNTNGVVLRLPCSIPRIGGVEGRLLVQLIEKMQADELNITTDTDGNLIIEANDSVVSLARLEETDSLFEITKIPNLQKSELAEVSISSLLDEVEWGAMLQLQHAPHETASDFLSIVFDAQNSKSTKMLLFTSDRTSINRTNLTLDKGEGFRRLVPLEFMKNLVKLKAEFIEGGSLSFDESAIIAQNDDAHIFCRLPKSDTSTNFEAAVRNIWPNGKLQPKTMVPIPDELKNIITQALLICKDNDDTVKLTIANERLSISSLHKGRGKFTATVDFPHPPASMHVSCKRMLQAVAHSTKMLILQNRAIAFRGPNQFWRFIASKA